MFENKIWLSSPTMHGEELHYVKEAYENNLISSIGENIDKVEELICDQVGSKYAVGLNSCTSALHLALRLAGVKPGDRVFCSDLTFIATANPILYEKAVPVFIDSEYETWNMDPSALARAFEQYPETKVVVVVDLFGTPAQWNELQAICSDHNAIIIEDAAESLGAAYFGTQTGTFGKFGAVSFNGNKIITGSSGGILLTDDQKAAETAL